MGGLLLFAEVRDEIRERFDVAVTRKQLISVVLAGVILTVVLSGGGAPAQNSPDDRSVTPGAGSGVEEAEYRDLQNRHQQLQQEHRQLREQNQELRAKNQELRQRQQQAVKPPYVVAEDRQFRVAFVTLAGNTDQYTVPSSSLEAQVTQGTYMRELSLREMERLGFTSIASRFEGGSKYQRLGEFGRYYQYRPFVRPTQFRSISEAIYDRHETDARRVRAAWHYTSQIHVYSRDIQETPRLPMETLLLGGGDCEDTAILAASILDAMPTDWKVQLVYMDADNPQDPQTINHVLVYVDTGEYQTYIETTSNQQMTPYTQVEGFYVTV